MQNTTTLKVKVLLSSGVFLAMMGAAFAPKFTEALMPFVSLVVLVGFVYYSPSIAREIAKAYKAGLREGVPQATKMKRGHFETFVEECKNVDYENYYIPAYLRRQEGV